jgi:hypothetical protein
MQRLRVKFIQMVMVIHVHRVDMVCVCVCIIFQYFLGGGPDSEVGGCCPPYADAYV